MKNQYMFFEEQNFEDFNLSGYSKKDISIPQTDVHIYEFECQEAETADDEEMHAKKLDDLTQRLAHVYKDSFQVISSESSQYFCGQLYPLVVSFETKLRYVMYVSRSLFDKGKVNKDSFLLDIDKKSKSMEEIDFGKIYEALFTDLNFQRNVSAANGRKLTKADLIKEIESIEENTMWRNIVGEQYRYIENHFLEIINYRNDVMHNHLIGYEQYATAKNVMKRALRELERVIDDKLIGNKSGYSNKNDIVKTLNDYLTYKGWLSEEHTPSPDIGFMIDGVWHTIEVKSNRDMRAEQSERLKRYMERWNQMKDEDDDSGSDI